MPRYVNLGCGTRIHPDWINIDLVAAVPGVQQHDLRKGFPLEDASSDVVYHSHVLEHIPAAEAVGFLAECFRVLKPAGILRVAVPDLEAIARVYCEVVTDLAEGKAERTPDHEWILLEMYDQTVRTRSGGRMLEYFARDPLLNEGFLLDRIGAECSKHLVRYRQRAEMPSFLQRLRSWLQRVPARLRRRGVELLMTSSERAALVAGEFHQGGEVHQWMYDQFSLSRLLVQAGFTDPIVRDATTSAVPGWSDFHLDTLPEGTVVKPDSLFMEARKPA